jgi:4-carboxymuconolactone decarboxylase
LNAGPIDNESARAAADPQIPVSHEGRIPFMQPTELDPAAQALWEEVVDSRGSAVVNAEGGLSGPFNVWLRSPELGSLLTRLGGILRFGSDLDPRLIELAIVTIAARWKSEFEWWAHSRRALEHGIPSETLDSICRGDSVSFQSEEESLVYSVANSLTRQGFLDDATYTAGIELLGIPRMVGLTVLCGYYSTVAFTLNAFRVPLPPEAHAVWSEQST